jgi:tetratricopeptide (TPR) repeat protein
MDEPEIEPLNFFGDKRFVVQIRCKKERNMNILKNQKRALVAVVIIFLMQLPAGFAKAKPKTDEGAPHRAAGVQFADQRQYDQAVVEFTMAIEINPKDAAALENRAYMYIALQKGTEALADFTQVIELVPADNNAYLGRAQAEILLKQFDPALADLNKALELKPDDANAYRFRGFADIGKSDWTSAFADFD